MELNEFGLFLEDVLIKNFMLYRILIFGLLKKKLWYCKVKKEVVNEYYVVEDLIDVGCLYLNMWNFLMLSW